jgi:hypothetical protein
MLDASKFKPGHIDLNGDILGPGIVIGVFRPQNSVRDV